MLTGVLLYWFGFDGEISRFEGMIFTLGLGLFIVYSFVKSGKDKIAKSGIQVKYKMSLPMTIFIILLSSAGLLFGARILVRGATDIAQYFQVSERAISLTVIAVGTSLPELATSVVAAFKKEADISIGNIIGSNIYNTFGILGLTAIIKPIKNISEDIMKEDILWMIGFFVLLFLFILPIKGGKITRFKGVIFLLLYGAYIYFVFK
jgi:cation:H+ antiporter